MTIAKAIRYAARKGADVINLSLEFDRRVVASRSRRSSPRSVRAPSRRGDRRRRRQLQPPSSLHRVAYPARAAT